mmetsp:Transcript_57823/g.122634  ORF Transcript_57823/g.122634 Transcript_57823/m.122634 type:complete len:378 (+) Transcript_57823:579-1712(+)
MPPRRPFHLRLLNQVLAGINRLLGEAVPRLGRTDGGRGDHGTKHRGGDGSTGEGGGGDTVGAAWGLGIVAVRCSCDLVVTPGNRQRRRPAHRSSPIATVTQNRSRQRQRTVRQRQGLHGRPRLHPRPAVQQFPQHPAAPPRRGHVDGELLIQVRYLQEADSPVASGWKRMAEAAIEVATIVTAAMATGTSTPEAVGVRMADPMFQQHPRRPRCVVVRAVMQRRVSTEPAVELPVVRVVRPDVHPGRVPQTPYLRIGPRLQQPRGSVRRVLLRREAERRGPRVAPCVYIRSCCDEARHSVRGVGVGGVVEGGPPARLGSNVHHQSDVVDIAMFRWLAAVVPAREEDVHGPYRVLERRPMEWCVSVSVNIVSLGEGTLQ